MALVYWTLQEVVETEVMTARTILGSAVAAPSLQHLWPRYLDDVHLAECVGAVAMDGATLRFAKNTR